MRTSVVAALVALASERGRGSGTGGHGAGTLRQEDGFATLSWAPVAGATDYQIERTPVGADADVATGPGGDRRRLAAEPDRHAGRADLRGRGLQPG